MAVVKGVSRRSFVGLLGSSAVAAPLVANALPSAAEAPATKNRVDLLHPLAPGDRFGRWMLVRTLPLDRGAVTAVARGDDGHEFRLEILARDAAPLAPKPPAETERFAVYVRNGGDGWMPTVEEQGLAAMTLAV